MRTAGRIGKLTLVAIAAAWLGPQRARLAQLEAENRELDESLRTMWPGGISGSDASSELPSEPFAPALPLSFDSTACASRAELASSAGFAGSA